jgi:hypothetical protein
MTKISQSIFDLARCGETKAVAAKSIRFNVITLRIDFWIVRKCLDTSKAYSLVSYSLADLFRTICDVPYSLNIFKLEAATSVGNVKISGASAINFQPNGNFAGSAFGMRIVRILNKFIEHSIAIFAADELAQSLKTPIYILTALFCSHGGIELAFKKSK